MTSTKQKTIAMSALAIVAVLIALFASAPLVAIHQANAFWGGWGPGWGYGGWDGTITYYGGWHHHYWW